MSFSVKYKKSLQGTDHANEDVVGQEGGAVWVLDGATGLSPAVTPFESDAAWYVNALKAPLNVTKSILCKAIVAIRRAFQSCTLLKVLKHPAFNLRHIRQL